MDVAILLALINTAGLVYVAWVQRHQTPAQKDKDIISNYDALFVQQRLRNAELEKEVERLETEKKEDSDAHAISIRNFEAVMQKREMEYNAELTRVKKDRQDYQIAYVSIRRIAVKYVPPDVVLPEVNGHTKDLK